MLIQKKSLLFFLISNITLGINTFHLGFNAKMFRLPCDRVSGQWVLYWARLEATQKLSSWRLLSSGGISSILLLSSHADRGCCIALSPAIVASRYNRDHWKSRIKFARKAKPNFSKPYAVNNKYPVADTSKICLHSLKKAAPLVNFSHIALSYFISAVS